MRATKLRPSQSETARSEVSASPPATLDPFNHSHKSEDQGHSPLRTYDEYRQQTQQDLAYRRGCIRRPANDVRWGLIHVTSVRGEGLRYPGNIDRGDELTPSLWRSRCLLRHGRHRSPRCRLLQRAPS